MVSIFLDWINKQIQTKKLVNIYSFTFLVFGVWMIFFDGNNLRTQMSLKKMIRELESEKEKFNSLYTKALEEKDILENNQERFAREKYYMHRENEDIFIIKK